MDPEFERNQQQDAQERKWVMIPMSVMTDDRLTLADKVVFGRAFYFETFFESPGRTASVLGISENKVKISKRKLEQLGYLECIGNDGRGKKYIATLQQGRVSENDRQRIRICPSENQNLTPENKVEIKDEYSSFNKLKEASEALDTDPEEKPKQYGNAQVNELLADWLDATGFDYKNQKPERYAIAGLIRQHGYERTKTLVSLVSTAKRSGDQFAPQIAKPSQLRGKYSKLEALVMWDEKRKAKQQAEEAKTDWVKPEYLKRAVLEPEYERSPEEDARITQMMKDCRKTMPFLIRAEERKRQQAEKGSE